MERKGYSNGNIGLRLTHLKARINELIKNGVLKTEIHPFVYTKIPTAEPKECDLTIDEFRKIQNTEVEGKRINLAKDMILLSFYLCGINLKDLLSINLNGDTITYERTKTIHSKTGKGNITIPIHNNAKPIINKYINKKGVLDLGYSYTYSNLQKYINLCIKKLKEHLGIKQTLCFYSARKTFAQFASELGIPDGVIDYCLGHSDKNKGIIRYYTKVRQKQAEIAINRVIDYVNNPDKYKDYIEMRADVMMMKDKKKRNPRYSSISGIFISITYHQLPIIHNSHIPMRHVKFIIDRHPIYRKTLAGTVKLSQSRFLSFLDTKIHKVCHLFPIGRTDE